MNKSIGESKVHKVRDSHMAPPLTKVTNNEKDDELVDESG